MGGSHLARILSTRSGSPRSGEGFLFLSGTTIHPRSTLLLSLRPTTTHSSFSFHCCFFVSATTIWRVGDVSPRISKSGVLPGCQNTRRREDATTGEAVRGRNLSVSGTERASQGIERRSRVARGGVAASRKAAGSN